MAALDSRFSPALPNSSSKLEVHQWSLSPVHMHSPELLKLVNTRITSTTLEYIADVVIDVVEAGLRRSSAARPKLQASRKFLDLVKRVLREAEVTMPTLLVTLVYLERAKPVLKITEERWALERIFLGSLIVASKYLNDITWRNVHWSSFTALFGKNDVGRIERQFLDVLDYRLRVSEDDILNHYARVATPVASRTTKPRSFIPVPTSHPRRLTVVPSRKKQPKVISQIVRPRHSSTTIHRLVRSVDGGWSRSRSVKPESVDICRSC